MKTEKYNGNKEIMTIAMKHDTVKKIKMDEEDTPNPRKNRR